MIKYFGHVAKQMGDGAEYSYKSFLKKRIGVDARSRWEIVKVEFKLGFPESQFIFGTSLYSLGKLNKALKYHSTTCSRWYPRVPVYREPCAMCAMAMAIHMMKCVRSAQSDLLWRMKLRSISCRMSVDWWLRVSERWGVQTIE